MSQEIVFEEEVIDEDEIVPFEPQPYGFRWTHIGWNNPLRRPGDALWPLALRIKKVVFIILLQPFWLLELAYRRLEALASNLRVSNRRRSKLLMWVQQTAGLEATPSLASVWHDGFVLCSVVRSSVPGACISPLDPRIHRTVAHAQELALKYLGVPAAFCDEETCQILSPAMERKLTAYLQSVQRASCRLRIDPDNPALAVAHSSDEEACKNTISVVVRGMGIVQAVRGRRAVFYIYLLRKGVSVDAQSNPSDSSDPDFGDIEIRIHGPQNDFGLALIPSSSYFPANDSTTTSSERRRLRFSLAPWFSTTRCANVPINFKLVEGSNRAVCVSYTPQSAGTYDLSILWRTSHVAGSPYSVMVDENDGRQTPTTPERGCSRRRRRSKVVLRVVDFVDEKMLLTDDGKLKAITPANLTLLRRSLSETRERVPFLLCNIVPETNSTDSIGSDGFMQSPHRIRRHRFVEKKRASHSHSLDESQNEKARERYRRLVGLCTLILRHTSKHKGLKILSAAEQILNGRPVKISEATDLLVQNVIKTLQPESEVIIESASEIDTSNDTTVENKSQYTEQAENVVSKENDTVMILDGIVEHRILPKPTFENIVTNWQDSQPSDSDYSTPETEFPTLTYDTLSKEPESEKYEDPYQISSGNKFIEKINNSVDMNDVLKSEINLCPKRIEDDAKKVIEMSNKTDLCTEQSKTENSKLLNSSVQISTTATCADNREQNTEKDFLKIQCPKTSSLNKVPNGEDISIKTDTTAENTGPNAYYDPSGFKYCQHDRIETKCTNDSINFMNVPNDKTETEFNLISDLVSPSDDIETEFNAISEDLNFSVRTEFHQDNSTGSGREKEITNKKEQGCSPFVEVSKLFNLNQPEEIFAKEENESQLEAFEETRSESNMSKQEPLEDSQKKENLLHLDEFEVIRDTENSQYEGNMIQTEILEDDKGGNLTQSEVFYMSQEQLNQPRPEVLEDNQEDSGLPQLTLFEDCLLKGKMTQLEVFEECEHESNILQTEVLHVSQEEINHSQTEVFEDSQDLVTLPPPETFKDNIQEVHMTQPKVLDCQQHSNMLQLEIEKGSKCVENPPQVDIFDDSQEDTIRSLPDVFEDSQEEINTTQSYVFEIDHYDVSQSKADVFEASVHDTDKTIDDIFGIISMESQGSESDNTSTVILNEPNNCNVILSKIYPEEPSTKVSDSFTLTEINFDGNDEAQCGKSLKTTEVSTEEVDFLSNDCENTLDFVAAQALNETDDSITNETSNIVNVDDLLLFDSNELGNNTFTFSGTFDTKVDMPPFDSDKQNILPTCIENEGHVCEIEGEANEIPAAGNLSTDSDTNNLNEGCMAESVSLNLDDFLIDHNTAYVQTKFADTEDQQFRLWPSDVVFGAFQDERTNIDDSMVDFESVIAAPNLEEAMRQLEEGLQKAQQVATENVPTNTPSPNVSPVNYNSDRTTDDDDRTSNSACDDGLMMQQQGGENDIVDSDYVSMDDNTNSLHRSPVSQNTDSPNGNEQWKQNRSFDDENFTKDSYMGPAEREIWGLRDEDSDDECDDVNKRTLRYYNRVLTPKDIQMDSISEETEETNEVSIVNDSNTSGEKSENNSFTNQAQDLVDILDETKSNQDRKIVIQMVRNVETDNLNENKSHQGQNLDDKFGVSVKLVHTTEEINTQNDSITANEETKKKELKRTISIPIIVIEDVDMIGIFNTFPPHVDGDIFSSKDNSSKMSKNNNIPMSQDELKERPIKISTCSDIRVVSSSPDISEFEVQKSSPEDKMHNVVGGNTSTSEPHSTINVDVYKSEEQNNILRNASTDGKYSPPPLSMKLKQLSECFQQQESPTVQKEEVVPSSQKVSNLKQYWDVNVNYQKRSDSPVGNERSVRKIPLRRLDITSNSLASTKSKKRRSPSIRIPGIVSKWKKIFEQSQFKVSRSPNTTGHESISIRSNRIMQWRKYWDSIGDENHSNEKNSSVRCHSVMETRPSKLVNHPKRSYTPDAMWSKNHSLSELLGLEDSEIRRDRRKPKSFVRKSLNKSLFLKSNEDTNTNVLKKDLEIVSTEIATAQNEGSRNAERSESAHTKESIVDDLVLESSTKFDLENKETNLSATYIHGKDLTDSKFGTSKDTSTGAEKCMNDSDCTIAHICNTDNNIPDNNVCTDTTEYTASNPITIVNETENNKKVKECSINLEQRIAKFKNVEVKNVLEDFQDKSNANLARRNRCDEIFSPITEPSKVADIPENAVKVGQMSVIFEGKQQQESSIWPKTTVNKEEKVSVNKLASIFAEKQQEPSLFRATRVRVSEEGITSSRFATPENLSTKDVLADLSRDTSDKSEPQPSISCSSPTPESSERHLILDTRQGSSTPSLPTTENPNPEAGCKTRFERAKTFFQSLERNTPPPKASATKGNAWVDTAETQEVETLQTRKRKPGNKIHSAPASDTESLSRITSGRLFLTSRGPGGSERAPKVSERFHVKDLFRDVVGSERTETTAGLRGIPHKQAVLAALRAVGEDSRPVSPYEELRSSPEPEEDHSRSPVPCEFQQEYPYLPNTPANLYRPRAALLTPTLIRRSELLRSE